MAWLVLNKLLVNRLIKDMILDGAKAAIAYF
jgi:hypothetical protein